nr:MULTISPECIES: dihydrofolate reductase [unclassified Pseudactinotalea]
MLGMIWAQAHDRVIGAGGDLPWHVPEDLAHFKATTGSDPVIHGRTSFEALPAKFRPLPGRRNIVLTTRPDYDACGAEVVGSLAEALALVAGRDAWICGGGQVYADALPYADRLVVTELDLRVDGDAHAPRIGPEWHVVARGEWRTSRTGVSFRISEYRRR